MSNYYLFQVKKAVCYFYDNEGCGSYGFCTLTCNPNETLIEMNLKNMPPGKHGFHVHEYADPSDGFKNLGSHYNPFNKKHGGLNQKENHLGDLGNIIVDRNGMCRQTIRVNNLPLSGEFSVIGRSMVVHAMKDDLGLYSTHDSITSGSSGQRLYYGIIGYMKN